MSRVGEGAEQDLDGQTLDAARFDHRAMALTLGVVAMAILPVGVTGTNIAFPQIEEDFSDASRATLSWALSGYSITLAAFTLVGGKLTDRFTGDRMYRIGFSVFIVGGLIAAGSPSAAVLIAGRCTQGVGGALLVSSSLLIVTSSWPREKHAVAIGIWAAAFPVGSAVAPALTAAVLEVSSWRWVFILTSVLGLATLVVYSAFFTKERRNSQPTTSAVNVDYVGIVIGTAAVGLLALGIVQGPAWGWTSWRVLATLAVAALLIPVFIVRSTHHPNPLVDLKLFKIRTYGLASSANLFISMAGMSVWLLWPLLMTREWGYSPLKVGLALTPTPLIAGPLSMLTARFTGRTGYRTILLIGLACLAVANVWFFFALGPEAEFLTAMLPGMLLYGIGMGLCFAPINAAALIDVDPTKYSEANAAFNTGRFLAAALGIASVVAAIGEVGSDPFAGFDRAYALLFCLSVIGFVLIAVGWPRRSDRTHP